MGQKGSKIVVSETCLRPHHAHKCSDVDLRKLRALIKTGKLAPCFFPYEGEDWREKELEECPICFLAYPALNRSKCCSKEICTECFLQVKLPNGNRGGALCPFCKAEFSVLFRGAQTAEEREASQAEEQRITEATLRAREAEIARSEEKAESLRLAREEQQANIESRNHDIHSRVAEEAGGTVGRDCSSPPVLKPKAGHIRRRSGDIDPEALQIVLKSLDLSEFIPHRITSHHNDDIEDAMLQQAIQASLEESQMSPYSSSSPTVAVQPDAVAFSPQPSLNLTLAAEHPSSPLRRCSRPHEPVGVQSGEPATESDAWQTIDLGNDLMTLTPLPSLPAQAESVQQDSWRNLGAESLAERRHHFPGHLAAMDEAQLRNCLSTCPMSADMLQKRRAHNGSNSDPNQVQDSRNTTQFDPLGTISSCSMENILGDHIMESSASLGELSAINWPTRKQGSQSRVADTPATGFTDSEPFLLQPVEDVSTHCQVHGDFSQPGIESTPVHLTQVSQLPVFNESKVISPIRSREQTETGCSEMPAPSYEQADVTPSSESENSVLPAVASVGEESETLEALASGAAHVSILQSVGRELPCTHTEEVAMQSDSHPLKRSQSGETCLPGIDPVRGPNSRTSSAISLDLVLESQRASSQGDNPSSHRDSAVRSQKPAERQPGSTSCSARSASQDKEFIDGASCATVCPALPSLVRQGSSSASSSEELIGALHSPSTPRNLQSPSNPGHLPSPSHASTSRPAKSPLPAPPLHLKAFLSGGKRFASPLSRRNLLSGSPQPSDGKKGPSFADLINSKGRVFRSHSFRDHRDKSMAIQPPGPLTLAMVMTDPVLDRRTAHLRDASEADGFSMSSLRFQRESTGERGLSQTMSGANSGSSREGQVQGDRYRAVANCTHDQAHVLYEEPGERGVMSLNEDGGAVFLTQPDGTTQLVLLTPDQRNQVSEVQALRQTAHDFKEPDTYRAPTSSNDLEVQRRIKKADDAMRELYLQLRTQECLDQNRNASQSTENFAERLQKADEAFKKALEERDAATKTSPAMLDKSDEALRKQIESEDAAVFRSQKS